MAKMLLSDVLVQLRKELAAAQEKAEKEDVKFTVKDIEVELQVAITKEGKGKVGFKVWLLDGKAGGGLSHKQTHTIKLHLDPRLPDNGSLEVSRHREAGTD